MSATLAGKCKQCSQKYYVSFGHPKWFDKKLDKKTNKPNPIFSSFESLRKTGLCPACGRAPYAKFAAEWKRHSADKIRNKEAEKK